MKVNVLKLLLATLALSSVAMAANRTTGAFLQKATAGYYSLNGSSTYLSIQAATYQLPSGGNEAYLSISAYDWTGWNWRYLEAWGSVPQSMLKVTANTLTVNIPDLWLLIGPDFYLSEFNFLGPITVNFTITATSLWRNDQTGKYTERVPQPDGTFTMTKYNSKSTTTAASIQGNAAGYFLPLIDPQGYPSIIVLQKGDFKSHFVP